MLPKMWNGKCTRKEEVEQKAMPRNPSEDEDEVFETRVKIFLETHLKSELERSATATV